MTKESLWQLLLSRNPGMEAGKAMTVAGYRKLFDLVWCEAQKEFIARQPARAPNPFEAIFGAKPL